MKRKTKNTLRAIARHLGLKVKFVSYFSAGVQGKLLPREKRILINAHQPRCEHIFTLLHEFGHFLLHFKSLPRKHHPRIFDIPWKVEWLTHLNSKMRRYFRFVFNREAGKEWQADLWAMCAFIHFAKRAGCRKELFTFLDRHPDKTGVVILAAWGVTWGGLKARIQKIGHTLARPFQTVRKS
jgi:hypothetical protein